MLALLDVESWLKNGGLALLAAVVFAESGLLIGFFLPGDSLLFIAGFLTSNAGNHVLPALPVVALVALAAAIAGDQIGYLFGRKVGPTLFDRDQSRFFNPRNVRRAQDFFDQHGAKTIVLARFVPVVRTFAPIVAGVGRMHYRTFVIYNVVGGVLWGVGITTLGHYLGEVSWIKSNIEIALVAIVLLSVLPMLVEFARHRRQARRLID